MQVGWQFATPDDYGLLEEMNMLRMMSLVAILSFAFLGAKSSEELSSGPQPGEMVGAFHVEKCGGNEGDGVENGSSLCYRCKLGNRPVVAVFSRNAEEPLTELMGELELLIGQHEDAKMASYVNLLGESTESLKEKALWLIEKSQAKQIAVVIPKDNVDGPKEYKIHPKAETTVLVYNKGKVVANFALAAGELNKDSIAKIKESAESMLN